MVIRDFCPDDIWGICSLMDSELGYRVSCDDLRTRIAAMLKDQNYRIFTAAEDTKIVGFIGLQTCLAFEIHGKILRITALAVAGDFQNQGIGSALIHRAETYAREQEIAMLCVNSGLGRTQAHLFYERQWFYKKGYSFCKRLKE